ncbi:MAG: NUDIX domain-containing protein [Candidatus Thiodiazotropha sp. DIVDIV]
MTALVRYQDQYIVARNKQWPKGYFSLIAGYLETGETVEEAVLREVKEELNLTGEILNFLGYYSFLGMNQLILAFEVNGTGHLQLNEKLSERKLMSKDELSKYDFSYFDITQKTIKAWSRLHGLA